MTCNHFVQLLWEYQLSRLVEKQIPLQEMRMEQQFDYIRNNPASLQRIQTYGRKQGWLEEQDVLFGEEEIERRQAARILHQFLRLECKEPDESDWQAALELQDLFDCRTCVNHVAQMYVKGIMTAYTHENVHNAQYEDKCIFGMRLPVEEIEAVEILKRAFHLQLRIFENAQPKQNRCQITYEEAITMLQQNRECLLVDVRSALQYEEWHMEHAIHLPMAAILSNPMILKEDKDKLILLYCEKGYQSEVAARCLMEHGYKKVVSFGIK